MSLPHALAAHNMGWQTSTCPQSLMKLATRIIKRRESEEANFSLPHMSLAWLLSKADGGLYLIKPPRKGQSHHLKHTATEPIHNPQTAWPTFS